MIGALIGDIAGSVYETCNYVTDQPASINLMRGDCHFTDDSILTIAIAEACLISINRKKGWHNESVNGKKSIEDKEKGESKNVYANCLRKWTRLYPDKHFCFGNSFLRWAVNDTADAYNSWGNGSAMRAGPIGWAFETLAATLAEAKKSAEVTHNHPEGIRGAQAVAASIFLARQQHSKENIKTYIVQQFGYDLSRSLDSIRPQHKFDVSCQQSVPQALTAFFESASFEHSLQLAISIGGDSDTLACVTGSIAEAFYGCIPPDLEQFALNRLPAPMKAVLAQFQECFCKNSRNKSGRIL